MATVLGSIKYTASGRKRNSPTRVRSNKVKPVQQKAPQPYRRDSGNYPSVDMATARHDTTSQRLDEKREISSKYTIAPAYNKGAYQVISPENIKDIGK